MPKKLLVNVRQNQHFNTVIEDPDPNNNRIFIENQAHDTTSLTPLTGQFYRWQNTSDVAEPYGTLSAYSSDPLMMTNGKWCQGRMGMYARQEVRGAPGHSDPWFASLDYENFPGKQTLKTSSGLIVLGYYDGYSTNNGLMSWWIGNNMAGLPSYRVSKSGDLVTVFAEDPGITDEYYAINYDNGTYYIGKMRFYSGGYTWTTQRTITQHVFFLGLNADGSAMFVENNGTGGLLAVYKYGNSGTPGLVLSDPQISPLVSHYQFPSNIRHKSSTEKIFYKASWDSYNVDVLFNDQRKLYIRKYVWNPNTAEVTASDCTLQYPTGKNYLSYQRMSRYESTWHSDTRNAWFYKCHQFQLNNKKYLTFLWVDSYGNGWSDRVRSYRSEKNGTWITYEITGNNDDILTFHSSFDFGLAPRSFPRYYMPINPAGTQLLIVRNDFVSTISFNPITGWIEHDKEEISAKSVAIDSIGRIYIGSYGTNTYYDTNNSDNSDGHGFSIIWQYMNTIPITINLTMPSTSYTYSGSPIATTATLEAYDITGVRVARDVKLKISGSNVVFADGSTIKTFTTSASGTVNVDLSIRGGGRPKITANLV